MLIEVTREDIDKGTPCSAGSCPIARAMMRAGLKRPTVARSLYWRDRKGEHYTSTPDEAWRFAVDFDSKLPVDPFTFELEATP